MLYQSSGTMNTDGSVTKIPNACPELGQVTSEMISYMFHTFTGETSTNKYCLCVSPRISAPLCLHGGVS